MSKLYIPPGTGGLVRRLPNMPGYLEVEFDVEIDGRQLFTVTEPDWAEFLREAGEDWPFDTPPVRPPIIWECDADALRRRLGVVLGA